MTEIQIEEIDEDLERYTEMERSHSEILNKLMRSTGGLFLDEQGIKSRLMEIQGNEKGQFWDSTTDSWQPAQIPFTEAAFKSTEAEFDHLNATRKSEGKRPLENPPAALQEKLLKLRAKLAVRKEERDFLKTELVKIQTRSKKDDFPCLPRGPMGQGRMGADPLGKTSFGVLVRIDGQIVEADAAGVREIRDPRSRYNGMKVCDYVEFIVKVWRNQSARLVDEMRAKWLKTNPYDPLPADPQAPWPEWPANVPKPEVKS